MHDLRLVTGISDASAYLREERGNIQQRVRLSSVADDECNAVGVEDVAPLEAGRGVKVYLPHGVGRLADCVCLAQLAAVDLGIVPAGRAYYLHLFGSEFCKVYYFCDKLHAVDEDVQVIVQSLV